MNTKQPHQSSLLEDSADNLHCQREEILNLQSEIEKIKLMMEKIAQQLDPQRIKSRE